MKRLSERAAAFLAGDGHSVVRGQLRRHGLPVDVFDDIVQGVLCRVLRVELETPGFEPENLEAWTSRVVQRETRDILRGRVRRLDRETPVFEGTDDGSDFWDRQPDRAPSPEDEVEFETVDMAISAERIVGVRRRLAQALTSKPYPAAAALCLVTISSDGAEPADDCPRPRGGVSQDQAPWWAAVFYSGRRTCFAVDGDHEDAAMRTRRSRALRETRTILEGAIRG